MQNAGDEVAVRTRYATAALHEKPYGAQSGRRHGFSVGLLYALADKRNIHRLIVRTVRYADTAADIDELDFNAQLGIECDREIEKHSGGIHDVVRV